MRIDTTTPVAWIFELARCRDRTGEYSDWHEVIRTEKPTVPAGAVRNLRPLYLGAGDLKDDCLRLLPGGKMDDSTYEQIEEALDKIEAPAVGPDGRWLTLAERILALRSVGQP